MQQNKVIITSTFQGYLTFLAETQPSLSPEVACQVAATLTQAEFTMQMAEHTRKA
ncbi:hypothetical protein GFS31_06510 [Leptolyngbya sp. BL0902]|uniref:hypothetical protein n=1 Tax=Leptolyngbya sp. BL0902 TaxID=1115757 RepID=UPI0018E74422|nr:hypothetical protein [Leptolyngbya sp. BL0902]QQE63979.1 hypothetical protein GFS31_06510 [Leptolyngbya sp. BL0902]